TTFYNHVQTSDSGYACIGYTNEFDPDGDILLVKTDAMGNMQWYKNYGTGAKDYGFCIVQTPDKGYLIGGHTKGYGGGDGYLIKTDSLGNEEWTEHYGHPTYPDGSINDIEQTNDGGYVFATDYAIIEIMDPFYYGKYNVIKLDTNYNLLWNKQFGILAEYHGVGSIIEANNGDLVLTVGDYLGNEYKAGLLRLTADGDSIEKKYITPPVGDEEWLFALQQTSDKGFVMAGVVFNPQQMWVVKVDSCGCDTTGCICDYSNILEFSESSDNGLLIYPNPANEKLTIKSCGNILQIEIIDYFGRVIKTISEIKEPEKTIDVSSLPKGLYLVRVYGEGFVETGKIVVN
ncbi:MAG: T9SS type A sorting domain-containing protein, partial [Bacteroidota bacterium]